jgi:hypothetical protein
MYFKLLQYIPNSAAHSESIKNAEGTKIGELKMKADATLRAVKKTIKEWNFNSARENFFATIDTLEINNSSHNKLPPATTLQEFP